MLNPSVAWIGLGSNLASPADQVRSALAELDADPRLRVLAASRLYKTTPVGGPPGQPNFCNAAVALAADCTPRALLDMTQAIEHRHGRVRDVRWGPRTLDLDIIAFDACRSDDPTLYLPHPRARDRAFVLVPLAEIAPVLELEAGARVIDLLAAVDVSGVSVWRDGP